MDENKPKPQGSTVPFEGWFGRAWSQKENVVKYYTKEEWQEIVKYIPLM